MQRDPADAELSARFMADGGAFIVADVGTSAATLELKTTAHRPVSHISKAPIAGRVKDKIDWLG